MGIRRILVWTLGALASGALLLHPGSDPRAGARFTFTDLTRHQVALATWATGLFDRAGLTLPPIDFIRHATTGPCLGRTGIASYEGGRGRVGICTADAGPVEEILFLHEIAHTWDRHALSEDRRRDFQDLRGLAAWRSSLLPWEELGAEQAAEIITWGLIDRPMWVVRIPDTACAELRAGYLTLTGQEPLHGYTDLCKREEP